VSITAWTSSISNTDAIRNGRGRGDALLTIDTDYNKKSFDDDAQSIGIQQMRFLAALGTGQPNGLFE
jgi:hypothetical protein